MAGIILATAFTAAAGVTISGSVVDETGNPVPSARISASAAETPDAVAGVGTSDAAGEFRFELPGGGNFQLRVEREGFFLLVEKAIYLDPSVPIDIHLIHLKELAESVDVAYSPPVVDPEQTAQVKRLDGQTILNLPYTASQDYRQALPLMSGAILDNAGQVHFNGGDVNETSYRLDGFDISDAATGGLAARVSVDTVQAVEWNANRMPAEDKGSAGTVEIRTEMGDDRWRFGATNPIPSFDTSGGFHLNHWSPRFMTSGPLRKGKVWFHTAFDPFYAVSTIPELPGGQNRSSSFSGSDLSRLQWNISNQQMLTASLLYNRSNIWNDGLSVLNPRETTVDQRTTLVVGTVKDQVAVNGNLIEAGFADTSYHVRTSPLGSDPYVITPFGSSGNFFRDQTLRTSRQEAILHAAFKPAQAAGTHQIRIGTDIENSNLNQTMMRHDLSVVRVDDSLVRTLSFRGSPFQAAGDFEAYAYVSDHWIPVPTVAVDVGLRTQWSRVTGAAPPAPRLAMAWAPRKLRGAKLSAGWGIYYDPVTLALLALGQEQTSFTTFYSTAGTALGAPMESMYVVNMRDLRTPRFTLTSLSAEKALPWSFFGRVDLTSRQGSRGFALDEALPIPLLNEYVINNSLHTSYRAAEVALRRTFLAKYQWYGSYTRSDARSSAVVAYSVENPLLSPQAPGPQEWDAPNRFLTWGWLPVQPRWFPQIFRPVVGHTDLQVLCEYHTGFPFSAMTEIGYLAGSPDAHRFPDYLSINVALERQFHFRSYLWALRAAVVNVMDRANPNVVNSDANSPQFLSFQRGQQRALNLRLRFLGRK